MKKRDLSDGFTLIELVVIIVIIGILAAVAIPRYLDLTVRAHDAEVSSLLGLRNVDAYAGAATHISFDEPSAKVSNKTLNSIVLKSYDQGDFPNKEILVTSLRLIKSMKENKENAIYFYEIGEQMVPVIRKGDQKYKLVVDEEEVRNFLIYRYLFEKKTH